MTAVKVSEAEGVVLDWMVAKAIGKQVMTTSFFASKADGGQASGFCVWDESVKRPFRPSTNWAQGGPLAERLTYIEKFPGTTEPWVAWVCEASPGQCGDTLLIALCRAIVAVELGDTVDVPDELLEACNG